MKLFTFIIFILTAMSASAMPGMKLFTLNTPDKRAYLEWLQNSGPVVGKAINASSMGVCFPEAGAPELNTVYLFRAAESMADLLNVDPTNPIIAEELAKADFEWEIQTADYWDWLMKPSNWPVGESWTAWNVAIDAQDIPGYLTVVESLQRAYQKNGFEEIEFSVWKGRTGEYTGLLIASVLAPDREKLGRALDAMHEPWFQNLLRPVSKKRKLVRGFMLMCHSVYDSD